MVEALFALFAFSGILLWLIECYISKLYIKELKEENQLLMEENNTQAMLIDILNEQVAFFENKDQ